MENNKIEQMVEMEPKVEPKAERNIPKYVILQEGHKPNIIVQIDADPNTFIGGAVVSEPSLHGVVTICATKEPTTNVANADVVIIAQTPYSMRIIGTAFLEVAAALEKAQAPEKSTLILTPKDGNILAMENGKMNKGGLIK